LFLLELVGFRLSKESETIDQFTTQTFDVYNLQYELFNFETLEFLSSTIKEKLGIDGECKTPTVPTADLRGKVGSDDPEVAKPESKVKTYSTLEGYNNKYVPMNFKRRAACDKLANNKKNNKNLLYDLAQQREMRKMTTPHVYQNNPYRASNYTQQSSSNSAVDQLRDYRTQKREDNYRVPREITVKDLEKMNKSESLNVSSTDIKRLGIRSLELSNNFRATEGKPPLIWNDELYKIAMEHSKNMAEGKVPVGHAGFKDRMNKVPFFVKSFSENVAFNSNCGDPVETAVIGWINSPGHRKNLLSASTHCAIAVYCICGSYYFTQLFALC